MTHHLITRLSKLDAPDREVDALIEVAVRRIEAAQSGLAEEHWANWQASPDGTVYDPHTRYSSQPFTASVDAVIALAERVLPESVARRLIIFNSSPAKAGFDGTPERGKLFYYEAATPAIAACIALLRAKEASQ